MDHLTKKALYLLYITLLSILVFICVILLWKPGVIMQYFKGQVVLSDIRYDSGYAYSVHIPHGFLSTNPFTRHHWVELEYALFEGETRLSPIVGPSELASIIDLGGGLYGRGEKGYENNFIYFSATDNSNPIKNGRVYSIYYNFRLVRLDDIKIFLYIFISLLFLICVDLKTKKFLLLRLGHLLRTIVSPVLPYIIILINVVSHIISYYALPFWVEMDTNQYIKGALSLVNGNGWIDASTTRGPGISLLIAPIFVMFGENSVPAIKILFHLFGVASVILVYFICRELTTKKWVAHFSMFLAAVSPNLILYGNKLLSEAPMAFFALCCAYFIIHFVRTHQPFNLYIALAMATCTVLIRGEYLVLLGGLIILVAMIIIIDRIQTHDQKQFKKTITHLLLSIMLACLPLLGWSLFNQKRAHFFGITNPSFTAITIYEGTFGAVAYINPHPPFLSDNSLAVSKVQEALIFDRPQKVAEEGEKQSSDMWYIQGAYSDFPLIKKYYSITQQETYDMIMQAVIDSIRANPLNLINLLIEKIDVTLAFPPFSGAVSDNRRVQSEDELSLFDSYKPYLSPGTINSYGRSIQEKINEFYIEVEYLLLFDKIFYYLRWFSILGMFICVLRKPQRVFLLFFFIAFISQYMNIILGAIVPRYLFIGEFFSIIAGIMTVDLLFDLLSALWMKYKIHRLSSETP